MKTSASYFSAPVIAVPALAFIVLLMHINAGGWYEPKTIGVMVHFPEYSTSLYLNQVKLL